MPQPPKRKLAAIMFTDMAGFTEMMQTDEAQALRRLFLADSLVLRRTNRERLAAVESVEALFSVGKATMPAELAAQLLGLTAAEREKMGAPVPPLDLKQHEETWEYYRSALGETAFAEWVEKGARADQEGLLDRLPARLARVQLPAAPWPALFIFLSPAKVAKIAKF
jgi:hypothetical protein